MLDFHAFEQGDSIGDHVEIIAEQVCLEVACEIPGELVSFLNKSNLYVEAALEAVCDFGDVGDVVVLDGLAVFLGEFELDFIGQEEFDEKVHDLAVLFQLEVVIQEHLNTSTHQQFPSTLVLMNGRHWPVAGVSQRP